MSDNKPNILLIMTDQQRYDSLGCYGFKAAHTPNLDRMAEEGVLFENTYVNNTICTPSRASIHTGKHLPGHGVYKLHDILPEDEVLFTKRLQDRGYQTALFGKLHVSGRIYEENQRHPNDGFDIYEWCMEPSLNLDVEHNGYGRWLEEKHPEFYKELKEKGRDLLHIPRENHMNHWAAERTIDFIENREDERPFFVEMSVFDPHNPYEDYPEEMLDLIDEDKIPVPVYKEGEMKGKPAGVLREHEHSYLGNFKDFTSDDIMKMRKGYHASIALIDLEIGRVLKALEEKGIADNTLVIFVSDHGDMLGDHQLSVKGAFFYDSCTKVPLIIRWSEKIKENKIISALVQPHDLAATILAAAGYDQNKLQEVMPASVDLMPLIQGNINKVHEYAICCYRNTGISDQGVYFDPEINATMIRDERYKLNIYHDTTDSGVIEGELYDMKEDPLEFNNLWDNPEYLDIRLKLTDQLLNWSINQEIKKGSRGGETVPDSSQQLVNKLK